MSYKLLNTGSTKIVVVSILYLLAAFFGFLLLVNPYGYILPIAICVVYLLFLVLGIYVMFKTNKKLVLANTFFGLCFYIFSIGFYYVMIYLLFSINYITVILSLSVYAVITVLLLKVIIRRNNLTYKNKYNSNKATMGYLIGTFIGPILFMFVKDKFGHSGEWIIIIVVCFFLFSITLFAGCFFVKKSYVINKDKCGLENIITGNTLY